MQMDRSQTDLKEEILAVVWTTMVNHDKLWLRYSFLVTQFDESGNRVLPCNRRKGRIFGTDGAVKSNVKIQSVHIMSSVKELICDFSDGSFEKWPLHK